MNQTRPQSSWPERCVSVDGAPVPFHTAQNLCFDSTTRITAMFAGSQGGKTSWGPWWVNDEIKKRGAGDYLAVTATYDLFKLKMLPSLLEVFEGILKIGRYWAGDRIIELSNPFTNEFQAHKSTDTMWGRIVLRAASSVSGLESATAKGAWLDECGQDEFGVDAWRAVRRRLAIFSGRALLTSTLYNLGWVKTDIIDRAKKDCETKEFHEYTGTIDLTENAKAGITLVQYDSIINPSYSLSEYEEARLTLPTDEFTMQYRGRTTNLRRLIYDIYDSTVHVCEPFDIPDIWNMRYLGLDFGGVNMCGVYFVEKPLLAEEIGKKSPKLYLYREYLKGGMTSKEHVINLLYDEKIEPYAIGGAKSEGQWRKEFAQAGLSVEKPAIADYKVGVQKVYEIFKKREIMIFRNCDGVLEQLGRYRRKKDSSGEILDEVEHPNAYHYMDAMRYIISTIRDENTWGSAPGGN